MRNAECGMRNGALLGRHHVGVTGLIVFILFSSLHTYFYRGTRDMAGIPHSAFYIPHSHHGHHTPTPSVAVPLPLRLPLVALTVTVTLPPPLPPKLPTLHT